VKVPEGLKYTKEHEWVKLDGNVATVGITDWAQGELGDVVFVELPEIGLALEKMKEFGTIEAVKAVSELFSPMSGKVLEVNGGLDDDPMVINRDPYGDGWMIRLEVADVSELDSLLGSEEYKGLIA